MPDRLAVFSFFGLLLFGVAFKLFVIDYMFPDANMHVIQDPWLLSPSLIFAVVITGLRFLINTSLHTRSKVFAKRQIEYSLPNWNENDNDNDNNKCKDNEKIKQRKTKTSKTSQNGMNGHTENDNDKNEKISKKDFDKLINAANDESVSKDELMKMAYDLQLSREQISDLKNYKACVSDYGGNIKKYLEVHFKLIMTVLIMSIGVYTVVLRDSAFYHPESLYTGENDKPPQNFDNVMLFYYWISLGYHIHRCAFHFVNHARKDFWAMFIHHWATITLISLSWISGFCETGCLVMFLHDNGDVWLPLAKLFRYNGYKRATDACFVIFTVTWVQFRMYWFFKLAIYTVWTYGNYYYIFGHPWGFICFMLLCVLQILHIYWFMLILSIVRNVISFGQRIEDVRSEKPPLDGKATKPKAT